MSEPYRLDVRPLDATLAGLADGRVRMRVDAAALRLLDGVVRRISESAPRTGREYPIPGTRALYTASAPGEPHADREGRTKLGWHHVPAQVEGLVVAGGIANAHQTESGESVAAIMEFGTDDGRVQPRPVVQPTIDEMAVRGAGALGLRP